MRSSASLIFVLVFFGVSLVRTELILTAEPNPAISGNEIKFHLFGSKLHNCSIPKEDCLMDWPKTILFEDDVEFYTLTALVAPSCLEDQLQIQIYCSDSESEKSADATVQIHSGVIFDAAFNGSETTVLGQPLDLALVLKNMGPQTTRGLNCTVKPEKKMSCNGKNKCSNLPELKPLGLSNVTFQLPRYEGLFITLPISIIF